MSESATAHPLDTLIPDPAGKPPVCDEPEFVRLLECMVADEAPRVFAVVQEYGERVDGRVAAWGMSFGDRVEVVGVRGGSRMSLATPDLALRTMAWGSHIRTRLVWVDPDAASPTGD